MRSLSSTSSGTSSVFILTCMPFRLTSLSVSSFIFALLFLQMSFCCAPCNLFYTMSSKFSSSLSFFHTLCSHVSFMYTVQYLMFSMYSISTMYQCPLWPRGTPCPPGIVLQVPHYFLHPLSSGCPICPPISAYHLVPLFWPLFVSWCVSLDNEIWKLKLHSLLAHYCGFKLVSDVYSRGVCMFIVQSWCDI